MRTDAFTHRSSYTGTPLHTHTRTCFYTKRFCTDKFLHTDAFTRRNLYTQTFLHRKKLHTQKLLHRGVLAQRPFHTKVLHTKIFRVTNCYTELHLHRSFDTEQFANIYKDFFAKKKITQRCLYTQKSQKSLHRDALAHRS